MSSVIPTSIESILLAQQTTGNFGHITLLKSFANAHPEFNNYNHYYLHAHITV